ncbi:methyl-accepting chemotaxis sensory transducer [Candidatus Vecturithrix granuli]|uniref:Methyl-accepting chemotaxis sensory transducer n=1 Tax=Vecturithrix granuli TaxID=1499967 RepID=A0A081C9B8_VECG1|nr:methyl-accepting chemotaxis sensory transducer [Candidatus Vecturithrix granuli]
MMTQRVQRSGEQRDERQSIPFRRRISTKAGVFLGVLFVFICCGIWYSYYLCKQTVYEEIQQRGVWIARNVGDKIRGALLNKDYTRIETIIKSFDFKEDIQYIKVFDTVNTQVFSQYKDSRAFSRSDVFQPLACDQLVPEISRFSVGNERFLHIGLRIAQPSDILQKQGVETTVFLTQQPASSAKSRCLGMLHLGFSLRAADETLRLLKISSALLTGGTLLLSCIGLVLLAQMVVRPLGRLSALVSHMAAGELRQTLPITSTTEIQLLEVGLSNLLSALQKCTANLKNVKEYIASTSEDILDITEEQVGVHQKQIMLMYRISQNFDDLTTLSVQAANSMTSMMQEGESGLHIAKNSGKTIQDAISSIEEIREQVAKNTERVMLLGEKIAQIDHVVKIITTIADQTKLIAFNASIEAAGAGEAGGRFSVVATEVRRLANTVVESVEEMKNSVSAIQTSASELILSSETGIHKVNQGTSLIAEIGQIVQHRITALNTIAQAAQKISDTLQQQQLQTSSMAESVKEIASSSEQILETAKRASEIARDLHDYAEKLTTATQQFLT